MGKDVSVIPAGLPFWSLKSSRRGEFAALLSAHLDAGTRPGLKPGAVGDKWTAPAFGKAVGVSERSVRNWRRGATLPAPEVLPFLLDALFGNERGLAAQRNVLEQVWYAADLRRDLEEAWNAADWRKASETLAAATPEPDAVQFVERDGRLVPAPAPASDHAAAQLPSVLQRHPLLQEKLDDLLEAIGNRLDNQPAWRPLPRMAQRLRTALDHPVAELPDRLTEIYDRTIALASFVELDDALAGDAAATDSPLDPAFRRPLTDFLATAAPWLRSFPSVLAADSARADMLTRTELFATIRPRLADARALIRAAVETEVLSAEDAARVEEPLLTAERAGFQAEKAGYRGLANARSLLTASVRTVAFTASFYLGAVSSDFATKSSLVQAAGSLLARVEAQALRLANDLPTDLASATRHVIRHRESFFFSALTPFGELVPPPRAPTPNVPNMDDARRMILEGRAPPPDWVPFIKRLDFSGEGSLTNLAPLAGLTSLQALLLSRTRSTDITPLEGLVSLVTLELNQAGVTNLQPLAGLTNLMGLGLDRTGVTDLTPLAGLINLQTLGLDKTAVADLSPLAGLTRLKLLGLNHTNATDLSPLAALTDLQALTLDGTGVGDLGSLSRLINLRTLRLSRTAVNDVTPLAGLSNLQALWLDQTGVTDLAPLAGLKKLTVHINGHALRPARGEVQVPPGVRGRASSPAGGSGGSAP